MKIILSICTILLAVITMSFGQKEKNLYNSTLNLVSLESYGATMPEGNIFKKNNWQFTMDKATHTPAFAIGKPIKIDGFEQLTNENIEVASFKFMQENKTILNLNPENIKFIRANNIKGKWYVSFTQLFEGLDVLTSEIELRINSKSEVFSFRITYYNDIMVASSPTITPSQAVVQSFKDLDIDSKVLETLQSDSLDTKLCVLPIRSDNKINYKLVYETEIPTNSIAEHYQTYVDAVTGELLMRKNMINNAATAKISLTTVPNNPLDKEVEYAVPHLQIDINGEIYETDSKGIVTFNDAVKSTDSTKLTIKGKYCKIRFPNEPDSESMIDIAVDDDEKKDILLDNSNSSKYERFAYHHLNYIHDWITSLDTNLICMEALYTIHFYLIDQFKMGVNAFISGNDIVFVKYRTEYSEIGLSPSVMYHEYGHSINSKLYSHLGVKMVNSACNEALADITSAVILNDSIIGRNYMITNTSRNFRNLSNDMKFPNDIIASHTKLVDKI